MKKLATVALLMCAVSAAAYAQNQPDRKVIEVSGSAERLITPDEFTFKITLAERLDKKDKITIEQQEAALRSALQAIGVNVDRDLSIYDISSTYFRQKKIRDVLGTKDYRLKIRDLRTIGKLQDVADSLNVSKLDLIDSESSGITRFRRETKIDAIKAAREKAEYLLMSINAELGDVVYVKEAEEKPVYSTYQLSNAVSNTRSSGSTSPVTDDELSFSQIKIRYEILARFEIR